MADITFEITLETGVPSFKTRVDLDAATYVLHIYWNSRVSMWFIDIMDADENPLLMGKAMSVNTDIFFRFNAPELPTGVLMLYSETNEEAGYDDLGDKCKLVYMTTEE